MTKKEMKIKEKEVKRLDYINNIKTYIEFLENQKKDIDNSTELRLITEMINDRKEELKGLKND